MDVKNKFPIYFNFVRAVGDPSGWAFSFSVLGVHPVFYFPPPLFLRKGGGWRREFSIPASFFSWCPLFPLPPSSYFLFLEILAWTGLDWTGLNWIGLDWLYRNEKGEEGRKRGKGFSGSVFRGGVGGSPYPNSYGNGTLFTFFLFAILPPSSLHPPHSPKHHFFSSLHPPSILSPSSLHPFFLPLPLFILRQIRAWTGLLRMLKMWGGWGLEILGENKRVGWDVRSFVFPGSIHIEFF